VLFHFGKSEQSLASTADMTQHVSSDVLDPDRRMSGYLLTAIFAAQSCTEAFWGATATKIIIPRRSLAAGGGIPYVD